MKVTVTPLCDHRAAVLRDPDYQPADRNELDHYAQGDPIVGRHLVVNRDGVWVDGKPVILRDRRAKVDRFPGHPWLTNSGHPDPRYRRIGWTNFTVKVEP